MPDPKKELNRDIDFTKVIDASLQTGGDLTPLQLASVLNHEKTNYGENTNFVLDSESLSKYAPEVQKQVENLYKQTQTIYDSYKQANAFPLNTGTTFGKNQVMDLLYPNIAFSKPKEYDAPDLEFYWNGNMLPARNMTQQEIRDMAPFYLDSKNNEIRSLDKNKLEEMTDSWSFSNVLNAAKENIIPSSIFLGPFGDSEDTLKALGFSDNPRLASATYEDISKLTTEEGKKAKQMLQLGIVSPKTRYKKKAEDGAEYYLWKTLTDDHDSFQEEVRSVWGPKTMYNNNYAQEVVIELGNDFLMKSLDSANYIINYAPKKLAVGLASKYLGDGTYNKQIEQEYNNYNSWSKSRLSTGSEEEDQGWNANFTNFSKAFVDGAAQLAMTLAMGGVGKGVIQGLSKAGSSLGMNSLLKSSPRIAEALITGPAKGFGYAYAASSANKEARQSGINSEASLIMSGLAAATVAATERMTGGNWAAKLLNKDIATQYGSKIVKDISNEVMRANGLKSTSLITKEILESSASKGAIQKALGGAYDFLSKDATDRSQAILQGFLKEGVQELTEDSVNKLTQASFNLVGDATKSVGLDWIGDKERYKIETDNLFEDLAGSFLIGGLVGAGAGGAMYSQKNIDENLESNRSYWLVDIAKKGDAERKRFLDELEEMKSKNLLGISGLSSEVETTKDGVVRKLFGRKKLINDNEIDDNEFNYNLLKSKADWVFAETDKIGEQLENSLGVKINRDTNQFAELVSDTLGLSQEASTNKDLLDITSILPEYNNNIVTLKDKEGNLTAISQEKYDEIVKSKGVDEISKLFTVLSPQERAEEEKRLFKKDLNQVVESEAIYVKSQLEKTNNRLAHMLHSSNPNTDSSFLNLNPDQIISFNGNMKAIKNTSINDIDATEAYFDRNVKLDFTEARNKLNELTKSKDFSSLNNIKEKESKLEELQFKLKREPENQAFLENEIEKISFEINELENSLIETIKEKELSPVGKEKDFLSLLRTRDVYLDYLNNQLPERYKYFKDKTAINVAATHKLGRLITKASQAGVKRDTLSPYNFKDISKRKKYFIDKISAEEKAISELNKDQKKKATQFAKELKKSQEDFSEELFNSISEYYENNPTAGLTEELQTELQQLNVEENPVRSRLKDIRDEFAQDNVLSVKDLKSLNNVLKFALDAYDFPIEVVMDKANGVRDTFLNKLLLLDNDIITRRVEEIQKDNVEDISVTVNAIIEEIKTIASTVEQIENIIGEDLTSEIYSIVSNLEVLDNTVDIDTLFNMVLYTPYDNNVIYNLLQELKDKDSDIQKIFTKNNLVQKLKSIANRQVLPDFSFTDINKLDKNFYLNDHESNLDRQGALLPDEIEKESKKFFNQEWDDINVEDLQSNTNKILKPLLEITLEKYLADVKQGKVSDNVFDASNDTDNLLLTVLTKGLDVKEQSKFQEILNNYEKSLQENQPLDNLSAFSRLTLSYFLGEEMLKKVGLKAKSRLVQENEVKGKYANYYSKLLNNIYTLSELDNEEIKNKIDSILGDNGLLFTTEQSLGKKLTDDYDVEEEKSLSDSEILNELVTQITELEVMISDEISTLSPKRFSAILNKILNQYPTEIITNIYKTENAEINTPLTPATSESVENLEATLNYLEVLYTGNLNDYYNSLKESLDLNDTSTEFIANFEQLQVLKQVYPVLNNTNRNVAFHKILSERLFSILKDETSPFYSTSALQKANKLKPFAKSRYIRGYAGVGKTTFVINQLIKLISSLNKTKDTINILVTAPAESQLNNIKKETSNLLPFLESKGITNINIEVIPFNKIKGQNINKYDHLIIDEATLFNFLGDVISQDGLLNILKNYKGSTFLFGDEIQKSKGSFGSSPLTRGNDSLAFYIPRTTPLVNPMRTGKIDSSNLQKNIISSIVELSKINELYLTRGVSYKTDNKDILSDIEELNVNKNNFNQAAVAILQNTLFKPLNTRYTLEGKTIEEGVRILSSGNNSVSAALFKAHKKDKPNDNVKLIVLGDNRVKSKLIVEQELGEYSKDIITVEEAQGQSIEHVYIIGADNINIDSKTLLKLMKDLFVAVSREKKSVTLSMPTIDLIDSSLINVLKSTQVSNPSLISKFASSLNEDGSLNQDTLNRQLSTSNLYTSINENLGSKGSKNASDGSFTEETEIFYPEVNIQYTEDPIQVINSLSSIFTEFNNNNTLSDPIHDDISNVLNQVHNNLKEIFEIIPSERNIEAMAIEDNYDLLEYLEDSISPIYNLLEELKSKYSSLNSKDFTNFVQSLLDSKQYVKASLYTEVQRKIKNYRDNTLTLHDSTSQVISEEQQTADDKEEQALIDILKTHEIISEEDVKNIQEYVDFVLGINNINFKKVSQKEPIQVKVVKTSNGLALDINFSDKTITNKKGIRNLLSESLTNLLLTKVGDNVFEYSFLLQRGKPKNTLFFNSKDKNFNNKVSILYNVINEFFSDISSNKDRLNTAINTVAESLPENLKNNFISKVQNVFNSKMIDTLSTDIDSVDKLKFNKELFRLIKEIASDNNISNTVKKIILPGANGSTRTLFSELAKSIVTDMIRPLSDTNKNKVLNSIKNINNMKDSKGLSTSVDVVKETSKKDISNEVFDDVSINDLVIEKQKVLDIITLSKSTIDNNDILNIDFSRNCLKKTK